MRIIGVVSACLCAAAFWGCAGGDEEISWERILSQVRREFPDVRMISTQQLADWQTDPQRDPPWLLDVRAAGEYSVSHLRGAVPADSDSALRAALTGIPRGRPVVVYCSVGYRSALAARDIQAMGFTDVSNLEGSIFAWANEGRPIFRDGQPVSKVHPYDEQWGVLLNQRYHPEK